jgi:CrcB protein
VIALLVSLGAAVGAPARLAVAQRLGGLRATLLVNVLGSAVLGLLVHPSPSTAALVGTGFCGAFTTYSTFAVEAVQSRSWRFVALSVGLCVGAAALSRSVAG